MQEVTPRVLFKQIPSGYATYTMGGTPAIEVDTVSNGWEAIEPYNNAIASQTLAFRTYVDLAGYTREELTTFIQGIDFQHMRDPLQIGDAVSAVIWRYDFFTTRRIADSELNDLLNHVPGYLPSTLDLQEMIYGEHRTYAVNPNVAGGGTFITTDRDTFGSGNASAANKLHWTQAYVINPTGDPATTGSVGIYACNLVAQAVTGKEKDLVYITRLARSYTQERSE